MKRILNYVNNAEVQFHKVREPMTFVPIHAVLHNCNHKCQAEYAYKEFIKR